MRINVGFSLQSHLSILASSSFKKNDSGAVKHALKIFPKFSAQENHRVRTVIPSPGWWVSDFPKDNNSKFIKIPSKNIFKLIHFSYDCHMTLWDQL